jgi:hypothetical protein
MKGKVGGRVTRRQFTASPGIIWCADGYSSIIVGGPTLHPFHPPPRCSQGRPASYPFLTVHTVSRPCAVVRRRSDLPPARYRKTVAAQVSLGGSRLGMKGGGDGRARGVRLYSADNHSPGCAASRQIVLRTVPSPAFQPSSRPTGRALLVKSVANDGGTANIQRQNLALPRCQNCLGYPP